MSCFSLTFICSFCKMCCGNINAVHLANNKNLYYLYSEPKINICKNLTLNTIIHFQNTGFVRSTSQRNVHVE